jgi:hypothetical protein
VSNRYSSLEVEECELEGNVQSLPEINFETDEMTMINPREAKGLYCEEKGRRKNFKRRVASPVSGDSIQMEREAPKRQFFHRNSDIQTTSGQVTKSRNQPSVNLPQLEIPETEMICGSVIIKAIKQGAKFTNEYELRMFFKEKIKSRLDFENNRHGNIIFLHLKEESALKTALEMKKVLNIEVTVIRKEKLARGVMKGIPLYLSKDQIQSSIQSGVAVKDVIRLQRYNRDLKKLEDSLSVMVVFEANIIPGSIWCCGRNRDILPYHRKVMQCYKCQKYGHLQKTVNQKRFA